MFGLALEGGGTKGAYHIGVYKAILELGLDIRCIVGSSIGAVNGALFAQGDWEKANYVWENISAGDVIALPEDAANAENMFDIKHIQSLVREIKTKKGLDVTPFDKLLRSVIDENKIRLSSIDFGLATFNASGVKEQQMFLKDIPPGKLVDYILASACLPVFQPKKIDDTVYLDGGITNNLPADMLLKSGYTDIICVEVGGIGISKRLTGAGCNIISVKRGSGTVGTLDFSAKSINDSKQQGYYDAMRTFGRLEGDKYYFSPVDYAACKTSYGAKILNELQTAAEIFGIDRFKVYTVHELAQLVVSEFRKTKKTDSIVKILKKSDREKTAALAHAMLSSDSEMLESGIVAGILGPIFEGASAISYFAKKF